MWIRLSVTNAEGKIENWRIEVAGPGVLSRRGLTNEILKPGTEVTIDAFPKKTVSLIGDGQNLRLPNGQPVFVGSSSTDGARLAPIPKTRLVEPRQTFPSK